MDYKDYEASLSGSNFWFRAKKDLIGILMSDVKKDNLKILSLGAGTGDDLEILNKFGKVYVIDVNKKALDLIPEKLYTDKKVCDACKLDYPDNFFDVVTSFDVFEHISEDWLAISEAYRVLKEGGYLIFSVPAFQFLYGSHDRALEHKRRYSRKMLKSLLSKFHNLKLNYWNCILFFPIALSRIIKRNAKPRIDNANLPSFMDNTFFLLLKTENALIKMNIKFPFGITIIGVCKK